MLMYYVLFVINDIKKLFYNGLAFVRPGIKFVCLIFIFVTCINLFNIFDNIRINGQDIKISGLDDLGQGDIVNADLVKNINGVTRLCGRDRLTILNVK